MTDGWGAPGSNRPSACPQPPSACRSSQGRPGCGRHGDGTSRQGTLRGRGRKTALTLCVRPPGPDRRPVQSWGEGQAWGGAGRAWARPALPESGAQAGSEESDRIGHRGLQGRGPQILRLAGGAAGCRPPSEVGGAACGWSRACRVAGASATPLGCCSGRQRRPRAVSPRGSGLRRQAAGLASAPRPSLPPGGRCGQQQAPLGRGVPADRAPGGWQGAEGGRRATVEPASGGLNLCAQGGPPLCSACGSPSRPPGPPSWGEAAIGACRVSPG